MGKLSYRDRVILIFVVIVVILILGFFIGIKPMAAKVKESNTKYTTTKEKWDDVSAKIEKIDDIEATIKDSHAEALALADKFTDERKNFEIDQFLQTYLDKNNIEVSDYKISEPAVSELAYYYNVPNILTYPLYEAADLDGSLSTAAAEKMKDSITFAEKTAESVVCSEVTIDFSAVPKQGILQFLDDIEALGDTIIVTETNLEDYSFGVLTPDDATDDGISKGTVTLKFYTVQKPTEIPAKGE